jgi:ATP-dependent helicase/nuclease subunit A
LRGNLFHRLMQSLPDIAPEQRADALRRFLARAEKNQKLSTTERDAIAAQVWSALNNPRFAELFAPGSRAEVPIAGHIGNRAVTGQVDRLAVTTDAVFIADYKTNRQAPVTSHDAVHRYPEYVRQLALYRAVLMRLYPGRPVRAALLWTEVPLLMEIPAPALDAALSQLTRS